MLSVFDQGPPPPCPNPFNLSAHVLAQADRLQHKTAVAVIGQDVEERLSYGALKRAVLGTGAGLLDAGCVPGDVILMRLDNTVDFPIAYLAALAVGLVPVPTSPALTSSEVARIVADLSPRVILRDPNLASATGAPEMGVATLRTLRDHAPGSFQMGDPDRFGYAIYTSGTSGVPRAVGHAHRAIWARQMMMQGWYDLSEDDVMLHAGAFNWTYTLGTGLMDPWTVGAAALIPAPGTRPADLGTLLAQHGATLFAAAPGVYRQMLRGPLPAAPRLRHGLSAGEKMPTHVRADWIAATGTPVFEAFGMSECSTFISSNPAHPCNPATLGRPQPGRRIAILNEDAEPLPRGRPGTIAIDAEDPGLMIGYLGEPGETADKFRNGWFLTGDIGSMDDQDQIAFLGRNDDLMNAGGLRVSPLEVETALAGAPGVTAVAVCQVEPKPGTTIIAAFYTAPAPLDEAILKTYVAGKLARYKHPRAYVHLDALPLGPNGKLLRRRLPLFWPKPPKGPT